MLHWSSVPWTTLHPGSSVPWTLCTLDPLYPGPSVPWTLCTLDLLCPGPSVPWTLYTLDPLYPGPSAPWTLCTLDPLHPRPSVPWTSCTLDPPHPGSCAAAASRSLDLKLRDRLLRVSKVSASGWRASSIRNSCARGASFLRYDSRESSRAGLSAQQGGACASRGQGWGVGGSGVRGLGSEHWKVRRLVSKDSPVWGFSTPTSKRTCLNVQLTVDGCTLRFRGQDVPGSALHHQRTLHQTSPPAPQPREPITDEVRDKESETVTRHRRSLSRCHNSPGSMLTRETFRPRGREIRGSRRSPRGARSMLDSAVPAANFTWFQRHPPRGRIRGRIQGRISGRSRCAFRVPGWVPGPGTVLGLDPGPGSGVAAMDSAADLEAPTMPNWPQIHTQAPAPDPGSRTCP